jgi:hypothetical protein
METGQDLQMIIYPHDGFNVGNRQCAGSIASGIYRLYGGVAPLTFSDSKLSLFFPISRHPDDVELLYISHSLAEI